MGGFEASRPSRVIGPPICFRPCRYPNVQIHILAPGGEATHDLGSVCDIRAIGDSQCGVINESADDSFPGLSTTAAEGHRGGPAHRPPPCRSADRADRLGLTPHVLG